MKIALLHPCLDMKGGAERQILKLAIGLQDKGHDVKVYVSSLDRNSCYPKLIDQVEIISCGGYGYKDIKKQILFSPYFMSKMASKITECDIIHCHNYPTTYAAAMAKKRIGAPIVWMCNEPPFPPLYDGANLRKSVSSKLYKAVVYPYLKYNSSISKEIDKIIVLDKMNFQRVQHTYAISPTIIHTGLDFPNIEHDIENNNEIEEQSKVKKNFDVLAVGRIDKGKRTQDAIKAISSLRKKIPNILLHIVGGGKELEKMRQLVQDLDLKNEIIFHGKVSDKRLSSLYSMCNVFLFTAENQSWGLVPLEAMSYKKPCIVSTGSGVADVLKEGVHCLKITPRDVKGLIEKIEFLYDNQDFADNISENGQKFVHESFSWNRYVEQMDQEFMGLLR